MAVPATDGLASNHESEDAESPDLPNAVSIFLLHTCALVLLITLLKSMTPSSHSTAG